MSKQPQRAEHEAIARLQSVKGSVQKGNLVLATIRGKTVDKALAELSFSRKKLAEPAKKLLMSAIANAENNHDLNVDKLIVTEAYADKSIVMKRWRARARGRVGKILKPRCHMTIVVAEKQADAKAEKKAPAKKAAKPAAKETKTENAEASA